MFCYAFICFCTHAACVLNICHSLIKILNNHFRLLSGGCNVMIKKWGSLVSGRAIFLR